MTGILQTVSALISTLLSLYVFEATVDISPSLIMYIIASLSVPTAVFALLLKWYARKDVAVATGAGGGGYDVLWEDGGDAHTSSADHSISE